MLIHKLFNLIYWYASHAIRSVNYCITSYGLVNLSYIVFKPGVPAKFEIAFVREVGMHVCMCVCVCVCVCVCCVCLCLYLCVSTPQAIKNHSHEMKSE